MNNLPIHVYLFHQSITSVMIIFENKNLKDIILETLEFRNKFMKTAISYF